MTYINLTNLGLKTFTLQDALDYCQINNINPDNITELNLNNNKLTDISGIKLFKNLKYLYLWNNLIKDISSVQYLTELIYLNIINLELESDQIQYIKHLKKLQKLVYKNGFKDMSVLSLLNRNVIK